MALRWLVLVSLAYVVMGQSPAVSVSVTPEPSSTMADVMTPTPTPTPATMPTMPPTTEESTPTMETTEEAPGPTIDIRDLADMEYNISVRYGFNESVNFRRAHFFCPEQGYPFVDDVENRDSTRVVNVWTLFLQYPVLAYLDSTKKMALIEQISRLIALGGQTWPVENFCIGRVYHYDVSLYTESVLINFYRRDNTTNSSIEQIDIAFKAGVNLALQEGNDNLVRLFQDRNAIVLSNETYGRVDDNVHPGAFRPDGSRFNPDEDPTLRAVILNSWPRQYSLENVTNIERLNRSIIFAANPNPVFYGLTGGDIVFIVIGTTLCALLSFLMVFGFCIQPFLM